MGGIELEDWDFTESSSPLPPKVRNIVLVGKTGNGKSATGNSILGRKAFQSMGGSNGVTKTGEVQQTVLPDGMILNVIDTPGLCDLALDVKYICEEVIKCVSHAITGIYAVVIVFSVRVRLSEEEQAVFECLKSFFGPKLVGYMIIVFTGGDELEVHNQTLEDYIGGDCPESFKEILKSCKNRVVLFNNRSKDGRMKYEQVQTLLSHVEKIVEENGGQPYIDEFFVELKSVLAERINNVFLSQEELLQKILDLVERKLERLKIDLQKEQYARLEEEKMFKAKLKDEKKERKKAEEHAEEEFKKERTKREESERDFKEKLEKETAARKKVVEDLEEIKKSKSGCVIL